MRQRYFGMVIVFCVLCAGAMAQDQPAPSAASFESILQVNLLPPLEFILHPVQSGFSSYLTDRYTSDIELAFKKEPVYVGKDIRRHALISSHKPLEYIGLAFDLTDLKLYIDVNRNLDLTDDGPGIPVRELNPDFFKVSKAEIELTHGNISVPYTMDIYFYGTDRFYALIRSGWQGEIELAEKQCEISLSDNLNGIFDGSDYLRFDHDLHQAARLPFGKNDIRSLPRWINFSGQNYDMECTFRVVDGETVVAASFTPITEDLMDVSFEGQHVSRIMLANEERVYGMLDWPLPEMRIPSGTYTLTRVDLLDSYSGYSYRTPKITAGTNNKIKAGGPLKQQASVARRGLNLVVSYALIGIGGISYDMDSSDGAQPPEFAVYQGDHKVLSDRFRYG